MFLIDGGTATNRPALEDLGREVVVTGRRPSGAGDLYSYVAGPCVALNPGVEWPRGAAGWEAGPNPAVAPCGPGTAWPAASAWGPPGSPAASGAGRARRGPV